MSTYLLHLADGRVVWAEGNTEVLLRSGWQPATGQTYQLLIADATLDARGQYRLLHTLRPVVQ